MYSYRVTKNKFKNYIYFFYSFEDKTDGLLILVLVEKLKTNITFWIRKSQK